MKQTYQKPLIDRYEIIGFTPDGHPWGLAYHQTERKNYSVPLDGTFKNEGDDFKTMKVDFSTPCLAKKGGDE